MKKHRWIGVWKFKKFNKFGKLIEEWEQENALADEGEEYVLGVALRGVTMAVNCFLRLFNDTPIETDGLADLTGEPSTNGYAVQTIENSATGWPTFALDGGDFMLTSSEETFSASGGSWGPVTYAVLATSSDNTGKLIAYVALSQSRTLADGESLKCTISIKLSEAA